jgi:hypothetical protein
MGSPGRAVDQASFEDEAHFSGGECKPPMLAIGHASMRGTGTCQASSFGARCSCGRTSRDAEGYARLFFETVFRHGYGVLSSLVSDRDPRFTSALWDELFRLLGTRFNMSTANHPETDGQTERNHSGPKAPCANSSPATTGLMRLTKWCPSRPTVSNCPGVSVHTPLCT